MHLTIFKVGVVPEPLRDSFVSYPDMFRAMFEAAGAQFSYSDIDVIGGAALPDPETLEAVLITGSSFGVYDDAPWIASLRDFIRKAYAHGLPMVGICYGHQAIADALGGTVIKSDRGWGLGRHTYAVTARPDLFADATTVSVTCSHQDQVIVPPPGAEVIMGSDFAPNAGLYYANGRTISFQPHPEFEDDYGRALVDLRRGRAPEPVIATALDSFAVPSGRLALAKTIVAFLDKVTARVEA